MGKRLRLIFYNFYTSFAYRLLIGTYLVAVIGGLGITWWEVTQTQQGLVAEIGSREAIVATLDSQLEDKLSELTALKNDDQVVKNASLSAEIANIEKTYLAGQKLFEDRSELVITGGKVSAVDLALAKFLGLLGEKKWDEADRERAKVQSEIDKVIASLVPKVSAPAATSSNSLPGSGYSRQRSVQGEESL